jgi:esterase/lipase superfamily enzyme
MSNGDDVTVYFATNRDIAGSDDEPRFGNRFNEKGPQIFRVGEAIVERVSRRRSEYRFRRARLEPEDLSSPDADKVKLGSRGLFETLRQQLADTRHDALVYLHGFANTFGNTMERAAALHDHYLITKKAADGSSGESYPPFVFAFSWPSDGKVFPSIEYYKSDRDDAEASGLALTRSLTALLNFLIEVRTKARRGDGEPCGQCLHLVAHSMGNWALRNAVVALARDASPRPLPRIFEHVFLMAADEDDDCFETELKLGLLPQLARFVHVYHSKNDRALEISDLSKPDRLGVDGPRNLDRINARIFAVDCRDVDYTDLEHGRHQYYRLRQEVIEDVSAILSDVPPDEVPGRTLASTPRRFRIQARG